MTYQDLNTAATDPNGPTGRLATWLANLRYSEIPECVVERAKYVTLDGLACALVGAQLPWSQVAVDIVTDLEGEGPGTIIGWGKKTTVAAAALLNGTFIQGFELDDYHPAAPLHSASLVIPALFSAVEKRGAVSGEKFLLGAVAGYETGPRVGMALHGRQMLSRGWHSGSVFGTHAAAVAAGKIYGLDAAKFEDALGLAGTQSAGLMAAQFEAMSKRMHHGFSARNGLYAATLAAGGYTGIKRVFEREYGGFLSVFGEGHSPDATKIAADLGQVWETQRIALKPYAAMGALHAPIDAVFELAAEQPIDPAKIKRVDIDMTHASYHHGGWQAERPLTVIGAQMNVAYAVAVAILDGAVMAAQFSPSRVNADDVWDLVERVHARHEPSFDGLPHEKRQMTRLRITFNDGSERVAEIPMSRAAANPLSSEEIIAKYRVLTDGIVEPARQQKILDVTLSIDKVGDLRELLSLLEAPVRNTFDI